MIELKHKLLGQGSVKNSQKVYYCAAPGDHEKFFESISLSLATCYSNISFWYASDGGAENSAFDSEESKGFRFDLSKMNLFVIPVTRKFLTEENRARQKEFSYAIDHFIPVLPILEEPGLEELFNEVCGNLQCLSVVGGDDTALPFETKLKSFLDTVLLGDETLAKIRESFGGYIFLSYRKKDRAQAHEVMRIIHRNPSCRDAAIWYDEFLTPGEDFNDSIREAFNKSALFALVVTPNILEENNYVMTHEYPMAVEANRCVMPIVVVDTDDSKLEACYPGLPERWACSDEYVDVIADKVRTTLGLTENNDATHRYYIGLAYLNGVDLETDPDRALSLITSAAEDGVGEAFNKLVDMYMTGTGVQRDYYEAAKWSQRYVDHLEKTFAKDQDTAAKQRYVMACLDAGNNWRFVLENGKALAAYKKSLSGEMTASDIVSYVYQMEACYNAALLAERMDDLPLADLLCERYFRASRYLSAAEIYKSRASDLAGTLAFRTGKWGEAIVHYEKGLQLNDALAKKHSDLPYFKFLTALYCQNLGNSYMRMGADPESAGVEDYFSRASSLYDEIAAYKFAGTQESQAMLCYNLSLISKAKGDYDSVRKYDRKAFELALARDNEESSLFTKRTVREALAACAESQELPGGDYNAAEFLLKSAAGYSKNIVIMAGGPMGLSDQQLEWVSAQAQIPYYKKIMELLSSHGERGRARKYKKELKALEKVKNPASAGDDLLSKVNNAAMQAKPSSSDRTQETNVNENIETLSALAAKGEAGDIESLQKAYDGCCKLARRHEKNTEYSSERNRIEEILADAYFDRGMKGDSKMLERAIVMNEALAVRLGYPESSPYYEKAEEAAKQLAVMYRDAAIAAKEAEEPVGKRAELYLRAYEAYEDLLEEDPDHAEWEKEKDALAEQAAWECWECGRAGEPMRLIRAYELFCRLSEKYPEKQSCKTAMNSIESPLAFLYFNWGKTDPRFMQLSHIYYRRLLERDPENERLKKNVRVTEKRVARHQILQFVKGNSPEKRQIENLLQGIVGEKVNMSDVANRFPK